MGPNRQAIELELLKKTVEDLKAKIDELHRPLYTAKTHWKWLLAVVAAFLLGGRLYIKHEFGVLSQSTFNQLVEARFPELLKNNAPQLAAVFQKKADIEAVLAECKKLRTDIVLSHTAVTDSRNDFFSQLQELKNKGHIKVKSIVVQDSSDGPRIDLRTTQSDSGPTTVIDLVGENGTIDVRITGVGQRGTIQTQDGEGYVGAAINHKRFSAQIDNIDRLESKSDNRMPTAEKRVSQ